MKVRKLQSDLLSWYDVHARALPWRATPGQTPDPYAVWLSEIMLQQTTVATVKAYHQAFMVRWPTVRDLAAAPLNEVLAAWAGLGYYSRARNLHACAQIITEEFQGQFPADEGALLSLPGIGPYTAAAISAIAFSRPAVVVDGNIDRVMTRLHASREPIKTNKAAIRDWAKNLTPQERPGDYAQALMDLGATVCRPTNPQCLDCPLNAHCRAHQQGIAAELPIKLPKAEKPTRHGYAYLIEDGAGKLLIDKRPPKGLLGGMDGLPTSPWEDDWPAPLADSEGTGLEIRHTFTHFHLRLALRKAPVGAAAHFPQARFVPDFSGLALPTLFKMALKAANRIE